MCKGKTNISLFFSSLKFSLNTLSQAGWKQQSFRSQDIWRHHSVKGVVFKIPKNICDGIYSVPEQDQIPECLDPCKKVWKENLPAPFSSGTDGDWQPDLWLLPAHITPFQISWRRKWLKRKIIIMTLVGIEGNGRCMDTNEACNGNADVLSYQLSHVKERFIGLMLILGVFCFWKNNRHFIYNVLNVLFTE